MCSVEYKKGGKRRRRRRRRALQSESHEAQVP